MRMLPARSAPLFFTVLVLACTCARDAAAAFPGENGILTFTRYELGDQAGQIATAPAEDNATVTTLTSDGAVNAISSWSPDGQCIAFYSTRDLLDPELYAMRTDGSEQTRLTIYPGFDYLGTFSPDGKSLVFTTNRDGDREIQTFDLATGAMKALTQNTASDDDPHWSPDGTRIVFVSDRDGNDEIYVMNADGSEQTRLTVSPDLDIYPDWSPDGSRIVFATVRPGTLGRDIWVMDSDGRNQASLVSRTGNDSEPAFSPDGQYIAFSGDDGTAASHIYVASAADGSIVAQVTNLETADDRSPDWQSAGGDATGGLCPTSTPAVCGDANYDAAVKATDALIVLRAGVGQSLVCPPIRCDTDDSGVVLASDALRILRHSVGLAVSLDCPTA